jgi:hypothetical protein
MTKQEVQRLQSLLNKEGVELKPSQSRDLQLSVFVCGEGSLIYDSAGVLNELGLSQRMPHMLYEATNTPNGWGIL